MRHMDMPRRSNNPLGQLHRTGASIPREIESV
jgi:hypothetical protein